MEEQESKRLLRSLGIKHHWIKSHQYVIFCSEWNFNEHEMNKIVYKFLLVWGTFMPEMHLK